MATMKLPRFISDGVKIEAIDLSYSIKIGKSKKVILSDVYIELLPGQLCALMGPSGAGKSTLLDLLADRKIDGEWSGEILFDGGKRSRWFNRESAYILQDDVFIRSLTVEETVYYSAKFRMVEGTTDSQAKERVNLLLEWMGLQHVRDSVVGDENIKGISGGQRKRLSIAVEIVALPSMIFFDEPTSGLDSSIALEIMTVVRNLANQNRTCVSTIHQPSPEVFAMFDTVALLAAGRLIYFGPVNQVVSYFSGPSLRYSVGVGQNPAEFIIEIGEGLVKPIGCLDTLVPETLEMYFKESIMFSGLKEKERKSDHVDQVTEVKYSRLHATTKWSQLFVLLRRSWLASLRDFDEQKSNLIKNVSVGVMIAIVFYGQGVAEEPLFTNGIPNESVTNVSAGLFFILLFVLVGNAQAIPVLSAQTTLYRRESAAFAYSTAPYWLAQSIVVLPSLFVNQMVFLLICYFLVQFPADFEYFYYMASVMFLGNISTYYFAAVLSAVCNNQDLAFSLFPISFMFLTNFSGFTINLDDIPVFWSWVPWVAYSRWAFEGFMVNQWTRFDSDDDPATPEGNGDVLALYNFEDFNKWDSFWILGINVGGMLLLLYLAMRPPTKKLKHVSDAKVFFDYESLSTEDCEVESPIAVIAKTSEIGLLNPAGNKDTIERRASSTPNYVDWLTPNHGAVGERETEGCRLTFRDIRYSVEVRRKDGEKQSLQILKGVSGVTRSGEMMALMGASGAGKSTLLDILADRKSTGETRGLILMNGKPRNAAGMRASAYVMQEDIHIGSLTVRQTLKFSAMLRLDERFTEEQKKSRVDSILKMLGLTAIADSPVGTAAKRGISGGQLKRLSIGVEIMHLPNLIFLDEPTTGLDSAIAYEVMSTVRSLAHRNRTIISTIHQPSPLVYQLFDTLLLLAEGRVLYFGPAANVTTFFSQSPFQFPYKEGSNAADFAIAVAGSFLSSSEGVKVSAVELEKYFGTSDLSVQLNTILQQESDVFLTNNESDQLLGNDVIKRIEVSYCTSTLNQLQTLVRRELAMLRGDKTLFFAGIFRVVFISIFYGTIYFQLSTGTDPTSYYNRLSLFYFTLTLFVATHQQDIPPLLHSRPIFYRERGSKATGPFAYWLSKILITLPQSVLNVFLFCAILYYLAGLRNDAKAFAFFYYITLIQDFIGVFSCHALAHVSVNIQTAINYFPITLFFAASFSGYIVYIPQFPYWLGSWAPLITYMRYAFQALTLNEFEGNSELPDSEVYIDMLGFDDLSKEDCAPILFVFLGVFVPASLIALYAVDFEKR